MFPEDNEYEEFKIVDVNLEDGRWAVDLEFNQQVSWERRPGLQPRVDKTVRVYGQLPDARGIFLEGKEVFYFTEAEFEDEKKRREELCADAAKELRVELEKQLADIDPRIHNWFDAYANLNRGNEWIVRNARRNAFVAVEADKLIQLVDDVPSLETFATLPTLKKMYEVSQYIAEERAAKDLGLKIELPENVKAIVSKSQEYKIILSREHDHDTMGTALDIAHAVMSDEDPDASALEGA